MITVCTVAMSFTYHSSPAKEIYRLSYKRLRQPAISFVDSRGDYITVEGRGTYGSGNIDNFGTDTDPYGNTIAAGTASGSYTLNTGSYTDGTVSCTYTPSGGSTYYYFGPATFQF